MSAPTLADTVARVRAAIEAFDAGCGAILAHDDLRTILAALPTPEERRQINDAILCVDHVANDPTSEHDEYRRRSWEKCATTIRNYLRRTGGPTDGE